MIQWVPRKLRFEILQINGDNQKPQKMLYGVVAVLGVKKYGSGYRKRNVEDGDEECCIVWVEKVFFGGFKERTP